MARSKNSSTPVCLSILVAGLLIALSIMFSGTSFSNSNTPTPDKIEVAAANPTEEAAPSGGELAIDGEPTLGSNDAKVTIIEFTDYQCPFCKKFAEQIFPQLKKDYVDTGKVKFVFKDLPLDFHAQAGLASESANCASDQGKYLDMHDKIFAGQGSWAGQSNAKDTFEGYAKDLGLDMGQFSQCLADGKYTNEVKEDAQEAASVGARGTPSFLINGKLFVGAQPYENFQKEIDALL